MLPVRFRLLVACLASCAAAIGCSSGTPMRPAGTMLFHADAAAAFTAADASLTGMRYSPYHGNPGMIVGSREDATAAAPLTTAAGVVFFPIGLVAGLALSPLDGQAPLLALAALPIADSGYTHRLMYVEFATQPKSIVRITVTATDARDAAQLCSELIVSLGQPLDSAEGSPQKVH